VDGVQIPSSIRGADRVAAVDAVVRLGVDPARDGWHYRSHPMTVGHSITFVTPRYTVRGLVRSVTVSNGPAAERR
jgi:hypothetical protein